MVVDDDEVSRSIISHLIKKNEHLHLSFICQDAIEAHNLLQKHSDIDILFLDVEMPEMSGLELVQALNTEKINIVLTTSREEYAVQAFEHNVVDYLVKPINYPRFLKSVNKVLEKIQERGNTNLPIDVEYLFVRANHKIIKIAPQDILFIEALSDYIMIYTQDQKYIVHSTMKGIDKKLEHFKNFVRIHRSYIINLEHIDSVQDIHVIIKDKTIPIGRSYRNQFIEKLDVL